MTVSQQVLAKLEAFKLKKEGANKYRCNSPLRPGSDSHSFTLTIEADDRGAWYDHVAGEGGSLFDLVKHLGIDIGDQRTPAAQTKRVYHDLADYAAAHGLIPDALVKANWTQCVKNGRPALQYPTKSGFRWRFLDGEKPYYISDQGYKKCWYGLNETARGRLMYGAPLVLCNGEISTVAGQEYGLAAACVTSGEGVIPDDLMSQLREFVDGIPQLEIIIALDCDKKGEQTAYSLVSQLTQAGYNARAVDLGFTQGGDLADFCALYRDTSVEALMNCKPLHTQQAQASAHNWYIIHASKLKDLPKVGWIMDGVIPERSLTVLYGPSGAGKSFLAVDYALTIAQRDPVVYMVYEGDTGYYQRIQAWCKHNRLKEGGLYMVMGGGVPLMNVSEVDAFISQARAINPKLVIVDTVARSMVGSDENSTRDMGMFILNAQRIIRELDAAVLVVHHTNKAGIYERGSGALRGAADSMIKQYMDDDLITVECSKTKDAQPFPTRYLKLLPVEFELDGDVLHVPVLVEAEKIIQTADSRLTGNQMKVLEALTLETFTDGAQLGDLVDVIEGLQRGQVLRILGALIRVGAVDQPEKRGAYTITEKGREMWTRMTHMTQKTRLTHMTHGTETESVDFVKSGESSESSESSESFEQENFWKDSLKDSVSKSNYQEGA